MQYTIKLKPNHAFVLDEISIAILQNYRKTFREIAHVARCSSSTVAKKLDALLLMFNEVGIETKFPVIAEKVKLQIVEQKQLAQQIIVRPLGRSRKYVAYERKRNKAA